jgi:hypothetical protein
MAAILLGGALLGQGVQTPRQRTQLEGLLARRLPCHEGRALAGI